MSVNKSKSSSQDAGKFIEAKGMMTFGKVPEPNDLPVDGQPSDRIGSESSSPWNKLHPQSLGATVREEGSQQEITDASQHDNGVASAGNTKTATFVLGEGTKRLSNLHDDEAADIYESRKKELLSALKNNTLKKKPQEAEEHVYNVYKVSPVERRNTGSTGDSRRQSNSPKTGKSRDELRSVRKSEKSLIETPPSRKQKQTSSSKRTASHSPSDCLYGELATKDIPVLFFRPEQKSPRANGLAKKLFFKPPRKNSTKSLEEPRELLVSPEEEQRLEDELTENAKLINKFRQKKQMSLHEIQLIEAQINAMKEYADYSDETSNEEPAPQTSVRTLTPPISGPRGHSRNASIPQSITKQMNDRPDQQKTSARKSPKRKSEQKKSNEGVTSTQHRTDEEETELPHDSLLEILSNTYTNFNKQTFQSRTDYLHKRGMLQKKTRMIIHEKGKSLKEQIELKECKFSPRINYDFPLEYVDIVTKTKTWQQEKLKTAEEHEREKIENEFRQCTFYPNGILQNEKIRKVDPNEFYQRNIEWQKNKEASIAEKYEQIYALITEPMKSQRSVTENRNESAEPKKNEKAKETSANYGNVYNGELANIPTSHSREVPSMSAVSEKITTKKTPNKSQSKASRQSPQREKSHQKAPSSVAQNKRSNTCVSLLTPKSSRQSNLTSHRSQKSMGSTGLKINIREKSPVRQEIIQTYDLLANLDERISKNKELEEQQRQADASRYENMLSMNKTLQIEEDEVSFQMIGKNSMSQSLQGFSTASKVPKDRQSSRPSVKIPKGSQLNLNQIDSPYLEKIMTKNNRYYIVEQFGGDRTTQLTAVSTGFKSRDTTTLGSRSETKSALKESPSSSKLHKHRVEFTEPCPTVSSFDINSTPQTNKSLIRKNSPSSGESKKLLNKISRMSGDSVAMDLEKKYKALLEKFERVSGQVEQYKSTHQN